MTERLYYEQSYLTEFDAKVTFVREIEGKFHIALDKSAFYPTSGGQPYDRGTIGSVEVLDVYVDDDTHEVWHVVGSKIDAGAEVRGCIDWQRRFDHMQQHAGDHMIASALHRHFGGVTIGLHISDETSTIDVAMPEGEVRISREDIHLIEADVNTRIQANVPIKCWFPEKDELESLPLRKAPTVSENVRIVAIGSDEMVACGGTHPKTASEIGLVKILNVTPARGKMRVCFVAGMRALRDYSLKNECATEVANILSTSVENIPEHVAHLAEQLKSAEFELAQLKKQVMFAHIPEMIEKAVRLEDGTKVICEMLDCDASVMKDVASKIIKEPRIAVLLGINMGEKAMFVFARSADVDIHMGQVLSAAAKPLGGKGGGRPDFAQGGGPAEILDEARKIITKA